MLPLNPQPSMTRPGMSSVRTCSTRMSNTFTPFSSRHGMSGMSGLTTGTTPGPSWCGGTGAACGGDGAPLLRRRRRMNVLRVGGLRGGGARNGRQPAQKQTSAGLHANL